MTTVAKHPPTAEPITVTDEQREQFLQHLEDDPGAGHVATLRALGVQGSRGQLRQIVREQLADDIAANRGDLLRREILRRGITGVEEDVWHEGKKCGTRVVYSDRLLEWAARTWLPEARQQLELTGAGGGPVRVEVDGGRVTGIRDVLELAASILGPGVLDGLSAAAARPALPAAAAVLPDPRDG